ncbi:hypothetical protein F0000_27475, partial [Aquimarina sp. RZ0]
MQKSTKPAGYTLPIRLRPTHELADVLRKYGKEFLEKSKLSYQKIKVLRAIVNCRTAVLGGHLQRCTKCDYQQ